MEPLEPEPRLKPDPVDPWLGKTLGDKYRIQSLIAAGGMGRVYRAVQEPLGRAVAVKVLSPKTADDKLKAEFKKRFFREAATCARLQNPNTVTLFDYGETDGDTVYMVMELVSGTTLKELLRESQHLDAVRSIRIAHEIALSLREAHRMGVVHRDLKPSNVMVTTDRDGRDTVKVLDFGLVKLLQPDTTSAEIITDMRTVLGAEELSAVRKGVVVGSPGYMSPEQIEEKPVDRRSDIYALGVILFECLTGEAPFRGVNAIETLMLHVTRPAPRVSERNHRVVVPDEVEKIVATCLAKDPARRYQRIDEMITALRHAMPPDLVDYDRRSMTPRPAGGRDGPARWWAAPAIGLGLAAMMMAALLIPPRFRSEQPPVAPAPAAPPVLILESQPEGAAVWQGAIQVGTTPLELDGRKAHRVWLRLEGYQDTQMDLDPVQRDTVRSIALREVAPQPAPVAPAP